MEYILYRVQSTAMCGECFFRVSLLIHFLLTLFFRSCSSHLARLFSLFCHSFSFVQLLPCALFEFGRSFMCKPWPRFSFNEICWNLKLLIERHICWKVLLKFKLWLSLSLAFSFFLFREIFFFSHLIDVFLGLPSCCINAILCLLLFLPFSFCQSRIFLLLLL